MPANGLRVNHYDFVEKFSTSSEVPQNHNDLPAKGC